MTKATYGFHLIGETVTAAEFEDGGHSIVRCVWGFWNASGKPVEGAYSIGACASGDNIWECAARCARMAREIVTHRRDQARRHATEQRALIRSGGGQSA